MVNKLLLPLFMITCCNFDLFAKDFERRGEIFPILEEDFSAFLQKRLEKLDPNAVENYYAKNQSELIEKAKNPKPVANLQEARSYHSFTYDPAFIAPEDYKDASGQTIVKKGERVNPLATIQLTEGLLFFDGSNPKHVKWAQSQPDNNKWILVKGSPIDLEEKLNREIYFDQNGLYSKKLKISHIPSKVTQKGEALLIEEIPIDEKS